MFSRNRDSLRSILESNLDSRRDSICYIVLARDAVQVGSKLRDSFSWPGWDRTCHRSGDRGSGGLDRGLSRNGVKNYSKGPCVTILE